MRGLQSTGCAGARVRVHGRHRGRDVRAGGARADRGSSPRAAGRVRGSRGRLPGARHAAARLRRRHAGGVCRARGPRRAHGRGQAALRPAGLPASGHRPGADGEDPRARRRTGVHDPPPRRDAVTDPGHRVLPASRVHAGRALSHDVARADGVPAATCRRARHSVILAPCVIWCLLAGGVPLRDGRFRRTRQHRPSTHGTAFFLSSDRVVLD